MNIVPKAESDQSEFRWVMFGFAAGIVVDIICFAISLATLDIFWFIGGVLLLLALGVGFWIWYMAHVDQVRFFKEREVAWRRSFNSWDEIHEHERNVKRQVEFNCVVKAQETTRDETEARQVQTEASRVEKRETEEVNRINSWGDMWPWVQEAEARLQQIADDALHLFDGMPRVTGRLSAESLDEGRKGAAAYSSGSDAFYFKKFFYDGATHDDLVYVVKHEMTHNWISWKGMEVSDPHGPEYQEKLKEVLEAS